MTEPPSSAAEPLSSPPATLPATALDRLVELLRATARSRTAVVVLLANAIPLLGVLLFGWSLWTILVIYWVENGIVGVWNIPRILLAEGTLLPGRTGVGYRRWAVQSMPAVGRAGMAVFFSIHYGLFWLVHGVFVLILPSFLGSFGDNGVPALAPLLGIHPGSALSAAPAGVGPFGELDWSAVGIAALGLFISHAISFAVSYIGAGEYRVRPAAVQMFAPYGRVVVLHLTILLGGFAIAFLGAPVVMLLALVLLKTGADLSSHIREHRPMTMPADRLSARRVL